MKKRVAPSAACSVTDVIRPTQWNNGDAGSITSTQTLGALPAWHFPYIGRESTF